MGKQNETEAFPNETNAFPSNEESHNVKLRADFRERRQQLQVDLRKIATAGKPERGEIKKIIDEEGSGQIEYVDEEEAKKRVPDLIYGAQDVEEYLPNLAAYKYAMAAKILKIAGFEFSEILEKAKECVEKANQELPKSSFNFLLPQAYILGIQASQIKRLPMPSLEKMANQVAKEVAKGDNAFLLKVALVLQEKEREEFLEYIPQKIKREVSVLLDTRVSEMLHGDIVAKGIEDEAQRKAVRMRVFRELKDTVAQRRPSESKIAKLLSEAMRQLGEDSRQLLLEILRDEVEERKFEMPDKISKDYLPRIIKVLLEEFDDFRGNDMVLRLATDERVRPRMALYFMKKLIDNGYLEKDIEKWWNERKENMLKKGQKQEDQDKLYRLKIVQKIVNELGVMPTRQVIEFIADDSRWKEKGRVLELDERVINIKESKTKFENIEDNHELVRILRADENTAMIYYLLNAGNDRFNLINNYDFNKFWDVLGLIDDLQIHEKPINDLSNALKKAGKSEKEIKKIIERLKNGQFPLDNIGQAYQEVSFEFSENAALKTANAEISRVMSRDQLGVVMLAPLYRKFLEEEEDRVDEAKVLLDELSKATTFSDRLAVIDKIEEKFPEFKQKAKTSLEEPWHAVGEKLLLQLSVNQILEGEQVSVKGEEILPKLNAKRIDLKRIKKELIVMLKGDNRQLIAIKKELLKKRKAKKGLLMGLEKQKQAPKEKERLQALIDDIENGIKELEVNKEKVSGMLVSDRFKNMNEEEKKAEIERLSKEILALIEKDPSAIFTYLMMQVLDEKILKESDLELIKEFESHLQGPFQTIKDLTTYAKPSGQKKRQRLGLRYLNKLQRFMTMVCFADSKICCFSSNNYEQQIQHGLPNKFWVASINADPLSFVISMELPQEQPEEGKKQVHENIGFIFGSFALDDNEELAIMFNGIYYAPGIESREQVDIIMSGVEKIFKGMGVKTIALASQYGGRISMPTGYSRDPIEMTRLRALDSGSGHPENKIYDDLGTGDGLNEKKTYGGEVFHKRI